MPRNNGEDALYIFRSRDAVPEHAVSNGQGRENLLLIPSRRVIVSRFYIYFKESVEKNCGAGHVKMLLYPVSGYGDVRFLQTGISHLRCHGPLPYQAVELLLGGSSWYVSVGDIGRTDGLVSLLSTLHTCLVLTGLVVLRSEILGNPSLGGAYGELRESSRVGTHICDESGLIQMLRYGHRLAH